jgi:hypothetical protein
MESNELDLSIGGEEFVLIGILFLFLLELEEGLIEQRIETVVKELAHWHLGIVFFLALDNF